MTRIRRLYFKPDYSASPDFFVGPIGLFEIWRQAKSIFGKCHPPPIYDSPVSAENVIYEAFVLMGEIGGCFHCFPG